MSKHPPFTITPIILNFTKEIGHKLGLLEGLRIDPVPVKLRKDNQIKTIQSTLSIEGNSLGLEEVQSILEGKLIIAPKKDIIEVKNAIDLYNSLHTLNPLSIQSFKHAHKVLMANLIVANGSFREKGVGIFKGKEVSHVAPPAKKVAELIDNLFKYLKSEHLTSWLIKSCVFHYELEFIHPFTDGNGRMGRLWQQLILMKENPIFEYLSVESLIKQSQQEYYLVLAQCDKDGESTQFIEYSLEQINKALGEYLQAIAGKPMDAGARLHFAQSKFKDNWFSRKEYIHILKNVSSATASRDLQQGIHSQMLEKRGEKNTTRYRFIHPTL